MRILLQRESLILVAMAGLKLCARGGFGGYLAVHPAGLYPAPLAGIVVVIFLLLDEGFLYPPGFCIEKNIVTRAWQENQGEKLLSDSVVL